MSSHDVNNEQEPQQVAEPTVRLCVLRTWPDHFDGYGFNLHAEKSKTSASSPNGGHPFSGGQFVGKVDRGSPAESAGLREGDRIVQVDGVDIDGETHSKVVARIKKGSAGDGAEDDNESVSRCSLLVVDRRADTYYREKGIRVHADMGLQILVLRTPEEPTPECLALQPQNAPSPKNVVVADDAGAKQQASLFPVALIILSLYFYPIRFLYFKLSFWSSLYSPAHGGSNDDGWRSWECS